MRVLFIQTGDYGEAWLRFRSGGGETFRDQRRSVGYVESLSAEHDVTVMARCARIHDEVLAPRLRSIGIGSREFYDREHLRGVLDRLAPEAVILHSPNRIAAEWVAAKQLHCLPMFADTFTQNGLRDRYRNWRLGRALAKSRAPCVCNHGLQASASLRLLKVPPDKIVPWEHARLEPDPQPKTAGGTRPFRVLFVGLLSQQKGVGDCIDAIGLLQANGFAATLTVTGPGDQAAFQRQAAQLGLEDLVRFTGTVSTTEVRQAMRAHDAVVVASRHDCQEGVPNTIFETLASRTPLVASDHPAFAPRFRHEDDALLFAAGRADDLAHQLRRLADSPSLYEQLSSRSAVALQSLYVGTDAQEILDCFLRDPEDRERWVAQRSLAVLQPHEGERAH
jgi:glycosyltransferase involved in cell wall biosynthesis